MQQVVQPFFQTSNQAFTYYGITRTGAATVFSNPEEQIRFSYNSGGTYMDDLAAPVPAFDLETDHEGSTEVISHSNRTLITP